MELMNLSTRGEEDSVARAAAETGRAWLSVDGADVGAELDVAE
jgi:hypothetical protein